MLLWRSAEGFLSQVPATLTEPLHKRLSMFILRSKVRATVASERYIRIGVAGPNAEQMLAAVGLTPPPDAFALASGQRWSDGAGIVDYVLRLPGERFELLVANVDTATALWTALRDAGAMPAGTAPWRWLTVRSGVAEIVPETQDQFVAQMLNLELVGAISFTKGCYPGQEIVARTQYRGEIKRRSFVAHLESDTTPAPASAIYAADHPDQAIGAVVMAAPAPAGGFDALVCVHVDLARQGELHLGHPDGARIQLLELPYPLPVHG
jgi:tRNA-modifying protein YgfZ